MFCTSCGSQIPDNATFCTMCGTRTPSHQGHQPPADAYATPPFNQSAFPRSASTPTPEPTAKSPKTSILIGVIVCAVVGIAIAVILAIINPFGVSSQDAEPSEPQDAGAPTSQTSAATSEAPSSASSASSASAASSATSNAAPTLIDLSDSQDYYDINIFLSNFAEWEPFWSRGQTYDRANYDLKQLVNWGMWHNAINNDGTLATQATDVEGAPASEISQAVTGISPSYYPRHMQTSLIEDSIARYMGINVSLAGYNPGDGSYFERDGIMYEGYYRGAANTLDSVALATYAENSGGNNVRISFTVYSGYHEFQAVADKSWYGLDGASLEAAMRANGSSSVQARNGVATVEVVGSGSERSFRLVSFEVADVN